MVRVVPNLQPSFSNCKPPPASCRPATGRCYAEMAATLRWLLTPCTLQNELRIGKITPMAFYFVEWSGRELLHGSNAA